MMQYVGAWYIENKKLYNYIDDTLKIVRFECIYTIIIDI